MLRSCKRCAWPKTILCDTDTHVFGLLQVLDVIERIDAKMPPQEFMDKALGDPSSVLGRMLVSIVGTPELIDQTLKVAHLTQL
jgi:hypothetical protein